MQALEKSNQPASLSFRDVSIECAKDAAKLICVLVALFALFAAVYFLAPYAARTLSATISTLIRGGTVWPAYAVTLTTVGIGAWATCVFLKMNSNSRVAIPMGIIFTLATAISILCLYAAWKLMSPQETIPAIVVVPGYILGFAVFGELFAIMRF